MLALILHKGDEYIGYMTADFELSDTSDKIFFEFQGSQLLFCSCNDTMIPGNEIFLKRRVHLPKKYQKVGHNKVIIAYRNEYATNGNGLHHFVDPEDKEEYLYSNFEPFSANKMFPCFDQPNLKATLKLVTVTPNNWVVVGNELELATIPLEKAGEKLKELNIPAVIISKELEINKFIFREFAATPAISTYLFACIAGPYDFFISNRKPGEGFPPMRIFIRKSLKKYVEPYAEEFFNVTECGVKFYEQSFGRKFPFSKHDQIYCPEFNVGAMENVGAVTYTEYYVFKDPPTEETRLGFTCTILHELSHMWFGDLVTMNWWNDLWLNESFATFISFLCMSIGVGLYKYQTAWSKFHKNKGWAYREDQEPTTHPITTTVENTDDAENIFDGITYMKGASSLKQLYYLVSHDTFCDGLKEYFKTYEWKNTELKDFIGSLQNALKRAGSPIDLDAWVKQWLCTKGLNELRPEIISKDGLITEFRIHQEVSVNGDPICRMHMLDIALYDKTFKATTVKRVLVEPKPITIVGSLKGKPAPFATYLNVNDFAFCKIQLDAPSIPAFQEELNKIDDTLTRLMIWRSLWDMVRDGKASTKDFLGLVVKQAALEQVEPIFTSALGFSLAATTWYVPIEFHKKENIPLFDMVVKRLKIETSENMKKHLINNAISFACTHEHKLLLIQWLKEGIQVKDAVLSQHNKYAIIEKIYEDKEFPLEEKEKLLKQELDKDKSDEGQRAKKVCEAALPNAENKAKLWNWLLDENVKESEHMIFSAMAGFMSWEQEDLTKQYQEKYFDVLINVFEKRTKSYAQEFFYLMKPHDNTPAILAKFEDILKNVKSEQKTLKKLLFEEIEDIKRVMRAQKIYREGVKI